MGKWLSVEMRYHMPFNIQQMKTGATFHYSTDLTKILSNHAIGYTNERNTPVPIIKQRPIFRSPPFSLVTLAPYPYPLNLSLCVQWRHMEEWRYIHSSLISALDNVSGLLHATAVYPLAPTRLDEPHGQLRHFGEEKCLLLLWDMGRRHIGCLLCSLVTSYTNT
jgi:hypothetical protein